MIQCINDQCDIFAHIACDVIRFGKKLRCLINKVCSKKFIKDTVLVSFVKFFHSFGEETEGGADKDLAGATFFKKRCDLKDALTGRNHIIDQDDIFAFKLWSEELVSCDRMAAFDHFAVVKTAVVHTHVHAKNVCKIDGSAHASLVRADDHEMVIVNMKSFNIFEKGFDKLI